jgi:predicted dehydrogenase
MSKKVSVGVIGTGHLGKLHTKMLTQISDVEFIGVYDINDSKAKECAKEFDVKAFDSLDKLLENVDAVSIAATTSSHYKLAKKCLEKNINIFVEKPITKTIDEAEELVLEAKEKGLKLQVGHVERFNPALLATEKYIQHPMFIQCDRLAQFNPRGTDVAVVLDLMIHDIDIILSLIKSDVADIHASGVAVVSDTIDIANARIEFENGAVANVTASRISQKKMRKMRIFQRDAYVSLDFTTGVSEVYHLIPTDEKYNQAHINFGEMGIGDKKKSIIYEQPEIIEINALKYELELFVNCILKNEHPPVTGEDGLRALKVAGMIIKKIDESQKRMK